MGSGRWHTDRLSQSSSAAVRRWHEPRVLLLSMFGQLVHEFGGVMAAWVVADVRPDGGVRLLVAVDHRLADGAVAAQVARERLVVVVVHSMTGHVMFQWCTERTSVTAEQLVIAEVHTQVIPELDLRRNVLSSVILLSN